VKLLGDGVRPDTTKAEISARILASTAMCGHDPDATRLKVTPYSRRAPRTRRSIGSVPTRPCGSWFTAATALTRDQVRSALGRRVHPDLPERTYLDVATAPS